MADGAVGVAQQAREQQWRRGLEATRRPFVNAPEFQGDASDGGVGAAGDELADTSQPSDIPQGAERERGRDLSAVKRQEELAQPNAGTRPDRGRGILGAAAGVRGVIDQMRAESVASTGVAATVEAANVAWADAWRLIVHRGLMSIAFGTFPFILLTGLPSLLAAVVRLVGQFITPSISYRGHSIRLIPKLPLTHAVELIAVNALIALAVIAEWAVIVILVYIFTHPTESLRFFGVENVFAAA